ncbi:hypothetical protein [Mycolicibacterium sp. S3B2]|uniref:hypothetical protein n=1 Tax=Mycolicibacterium sp. S3B2 TaxID=3415120 RepID=UPI003C7DE72E
MDKKAVQQILIGELKELRKGSGVHKVDAASKDTLLGQMADGSNRKLQKLIWNGTRNMKPADQRVLYNALLINEHLLANDAVSRLPDLTARREYYCKKHSVSLRTLTRHEDAAIETLAKVLYVGLEYSYEKYADFINRSLGRVQPDFSELFDHYEDLLKDENYQPPPLPTVNAEGKFEFPSTEKRDEPKSEAHNLLRQQHAAIQAAKHGSLQDVFLQLQVLEELTEKLGRLLGLPPGWQD